MSAELLVRNNERKTTGKAIPVSYVLRQIEDDRYRLAKKVPLRVDVSETGQFVVHHARLNVYGAGETIEQAVNEFASMLVDLFEELQESEKVLAAPLHQQLTILRSMLAIR